MVGMSPCRLNNENFARTFPLKSVGTPTFNEAFHIWRR